MSAARLLIVDDEVALLDLLKRYLERMGYEVDVASTAEDALARFETDPLQYACVLTDLVLPGINGEQLLERMREKNPKLRALVSSGYPYEPPSKKTLFLQKPYVPKMLAETLEKLLGGTRQKS
jgi:two-component system, cell cycle sensor histidine kinase and response regulator CckA